MGVWRRTAELKGKNPLLSYGEQIVAAVISAALASLATEDELGPWLAGNYGVLANAQANLLDQLDIRANHSGRIEVNYGKRSKQKTEARRRL